MLWKPIGLLAVVLLASCATTYGVGENRRLSPAEAEAAYVSKHMTGGTNLDAPPRVIRAPMPEYPEEARKARHEGPVVLRFTVNEDGRTSDFAAVTTPNRDLLRPVVAAVRQWQFTPPTRDGKPTNAAFEITFDYRLNTWW